MSASRIITGDEGRLDNVHPGAVLRDDFMIGSEISVAEVSAGSGIGLDRLGDLLAGRLAIDADADIRLARYFGISEGLLLGLQNDYDLEEVRRAAGGELDRIVRRAA